MIASPAAAMLAALPPLPPRPAPCPARPLLGLTLLAVSACAPTVEGLRSAVLAGGGRLRHAAGAEAAARHLRLWRPAAVLVDLALPDALTLLEDLACLRPRLERLVALAPDRRDAVPAGARPVGAPGADAVLPRGLHDPSRLAQALLGRAEESARRTGRVLPFPLTRPGAPAVAGMQPRPSPTASADLCGRGGPPYRAAGRQPAACASSSEQNHRSPRAGSMVVRS